MPYQPAHPLSQSLRYQKKPDLKHYHFEREALFFVASSKALCSIQEVCYILLVSTFKKKKKNASGGKKKKKDDRAVMGNKDPRNRTVLELQSTSQKLLFQL